MFLFVGAMERATSSDPTEIFLLQEFCKDEDEKIDKKSKKKRRQSTNEISGVRLLGRRSMDPRALLDQTTNNNPAERDGSITDDSQTQSMDSTMENESFQNADNTFQAHKELTKFRLSTLLDFKDNDEVNTLVKDNLFEDLGEDLNGKLRMKIAVLTKIFECFIIFSYF